MFFITKTIYLNIFKNFGAVKLMLELNLYHYSTFLLSGWHIATHKILQVLKKLYAYIEKYHSSNFRIIPEAKV